MKTTKENEIIIFKTKETFVKLIVNLINKRNG